MMGGFEAPIFLGVLAYSTEPEVTVVKNENGLIITKILVSRVNNRKFEYTYINPAASLPVTKTASATIQTNITCETGKLQIERTLASENGINKATADIRTGKLLIDYNPDTRALTRVVMILNEAGFDADQKNQRIRVQILAPSKRQQQLLPQFKQILIVQKAKIKLKEN